MTGVIKNIDDLSMQVYKKLYDDITSINDKFVPSISYEKEKTDIFFTLSIEGITYANAQDIQKLKLDLQIVQDYINNFDYKGIQVTWE